MSWSREKRALPRRARYSRDPLAHEADMPRADVLVGNEDVAGLGVLADLIEQQVGLVDAGAYRTNTI